MQAIARVLETVPHSSNTLIIRTDSKYSQQCAQPSLSHLHLTSIRYLLYNLNTALTEWAFGWRKNGWRTTAGKPALNKELIDYTLTLLETRQRSGQPVNIEYVKGHSGNVGNDGADTLAVAGCDFPEEPERDWARLKQTYRLEKVSTTGPVVSPTTGSICQTAGVLMNGTQGSPHGALFAGSSSTGATHAPSKSSLSSTSKSPQQSTSRTTTTLALGPPVQTSRIAAPKNRTVDIVYSDGACRANGTANAVGGIGVWWGPNDPR